MAILYEAQDAFQATISAIPAGEVCGGRLEVVLGGGSQTKLATYLIPPVSERLAGGNGFR